jgi:hypothetical protein
LIASFVMGDLAGNAPQQTEIGTLLPVPEYGQQQVQILCRAMDLVLLVDVTGSISVSTELQDALKHLIDCAAIGADGDLRVGLIAITGITSGQDVIHVARWNNLTLTSDLTNVKDTIGVLPTLAIGNGGNGPEASDEAIREMLQAAGPPFTGSQCPGNVGDFITPFRSNVRRLAVLVTDAPPWRLR